MNHTRFQVSDAVELAHALCGAIAVQRGYRVLSVKGFTLARHGLRKARTYADADVWVEPENYKSFLQEMYFRGWQVRQIQHSARELEVHSTTLIHDGWPCDIDVHWYFPGCFVDPTQSFDTIWSHRIEATIADTVVWIPDFAASSLIAVLHSCRAPKRGRESAELEQYIAAIRQSSADQRAEIERLFVSTRSGSAIPAEIEQLLCLPHGLLRDRKDVGRWEMHTALLGSGTSLGWLKQIWEAPVGSRLRTALAALSLSKIDREYSEERQKKIGLYRKRIMRGIRGLPRAISELWKYYRSQKTNS